MIDDAETDRKDLETLQKILGPRWKVQSVDDAIDEAYKTAGLNNPWTTTPGLRGDRGER